MLQLCSGSEPARLPTGRRPHAGSPEADRRWAPPRGRRASEERGRWQVARRPALGCRRQEPREPRASLLPGFAQAVSSLTRSTGRVPTLLYSKLLKPRSPSPRIPVEKLSWITSPFSGAGSLTSLHSSHVFFIVALDNTRQSWRSVFGKLDGWAPGVSGALCLEEGISFRWPRTYGALSLLQARRTIAALILPQQDAIGLRKHSFQRRLYRKP